MRTHSYQNRSLHKQKGVAAIWMALLLVPIMGITFWAVEGTRYIQESSRLRDSAEAAALAVTIEDKPGAASVMAENYVRSYVRDIKSINVQAERREPGNSRNEEAADFIQYTVNATTTHDSWFANSFIPSFDETQDIAGRSLARKYLSSVGGKNIDIVFVSDFSGSMNFDWMDPNGNKKIDDLKTAIRAISNKFICQDVRNEFVEGELKPVCHDQEDGYTADKLKNRVGFVPFNSRTREKRGSSVYATSQLKYKDNYKTDISSVSYKGVDWDYWTRFRSEEIKNCATNSNFCEAPRQERHLEAKRAIDVLEYHTLPSYGIDWGFMDSAEYVDVDESVNTMFIDKSKEKSNYYRVAPDIKLFGVPEDFDELQFNNISLTNRSEEIKAIDLMWANGATAAFQGILRGSQILYDGKPDGSDQQELQAYNDKLKIMFILSDGEETPHDNGILKSLVKAGMCDKARDKIPGLYIGFIGIDFHATQQDAFKQCVLDSEQDIIDVHDVDELIEKIEELIGKGSKSSGITKLY